jgi:hypothetical protein
MFNWCLKELEEKAYSFSKKIKASVKKAVKHISDFEETATELAIEINTTLLFAVIFMSQNY